MFNRPFEEINIQDIIDLKENAIPEGTAIDYKEQLHLITREQRKEFAADITSFANTNGGYLLFGVSENAGLIDDITGVEIENIDSLKLQIDSLLRDIVEPRINSIQMKSIEINNNKSIFIVHIPRSYSGPHIVRGKEYYGRNTAGKYQLEYNEIKRRFLENDTLYKEIHNFHIDRTFKIKSNQGYMQLVQGSTIMLHIVPLSSFGFDSPTLNLGSPATGQYWPLYRSGAEYHVGFEGIGWSSNINNSCYGYHHINRRGIVEIVDRIILRPRDNDRPSIHIPMLEEKLNQVSINIGQNYQRFNVDGPFVVCFALLDVGQAIFSNQNGFFTQHNNLQNDLIFPDMVINNFDEFTSFVTKVINLLYNAAGYTERPTLYY